MSDGYDLDWNKKALLGFIQSILIIQKWPKLVPNFDKTLLSKTNYFKALNFELIFKLF
jgi:hypothetical protein